MSLNTISLGLLGGGSIAKTVAGAVAEGHLPNVAVTGVVGASEPPSHRIEATARMVGATACSFDKLLDLNPDWVLEAAGAQALQNYLPHLVESRTNLIVMSIGALLDPHIWDLVRQKRQAGGKVLLPSGAIGGLDVVGALNALGDLERVQITTTKAPSGLTGAPYLTEQGIDLSPNDRSVIFDGQASRAVKGFPANVNVAAALSIAGIGPDRTRVRIVSDPSAERTVHEIEAEGPTGKVSLRVESEPNPVNPKSSYLAALSAIETLKGIGGRS